MSTTGIELIEQILSRCDETLEDLVELGMSPNSKKVYDRLFTATEAAQMANRTRATLYRISEDDEIKYGLSPSKHENTGRVMGYSLEQINRLRNYFRTSPQRSDSDPTIKVAIQSFKGGVSKSVTTVYLAQYLALKGYRVLIVDCDPQASATSSFGFIPDKSFNDSNTLSPYLEGHYDTLDYAVVETYFPGIHLIPACLPLYEAEFGLFNAIAQADTKEEKASYYYELSNALSTIDHNYDMILIDSPPALSAISINIAIAANGIIVPTPPSLYDFASTTQYFRMLHRILSGIAPNKAYDFIKVMPSKVEKTKGLQMDFLDTMRDQFGSMMTTAVFTMTSAIPNNARFFKTFFDGKFNSKKDEKVKNMLESLFGELEKEIIKCWPSQRGAVSRSHQLSQPSVSSESPEGIAI